MEKLNMNVTLILSLASLLNKQFNLEEKISDAIRTTNDFFMMDFDNYVIESTEIPENKKESFLKYIKETEDFSKVIEWNTDSVCVDTYWYQKMGGEENVVCNLPVMIDMECLYKMFLKNEK